ncbi:class-II aminoacyl-tRNA synthetase family protein [Actinoplanes siamensis]|uniref:Aminoacyl-transfer RNA synthetases class-II family profile domain-containing protein n=1 Tax=Actinoplanes siamensis TaxID=1223317 RepID=A0A919NDR4_9ACTN|nr:hypothetical protein [Actinoplanes siamensis]GIF09364.1 hypothetical protein Asi03nite_69020 [Actinoplanes siamensis]
MQSVVRSPAEARVWRSHTELSAQAGKAFQELLPYCVPGVQEWTCHDEGGPVVTFVPGHGMPAEEIEDRLSEALRRALLTPTRPPRILYDRPAVPASGASEAADVRTTGQGLIVLGPVMARLAGAVDEYARRTAAELGAAEYGVPHLVSWETIERAGYARTFPQHLTACSVVQGDLGALDRFAAAEGRDARSTELTTAPVTLSPTVCMHLFAAHADRALPEPVLATARQACARHELIQEGATRLWSFNMREIIYLGHQSGARDLCRDVMARLIAFTEELGLPATISSASDPFFTVERDALTGYQSRLDLKQELRGRMRDGREVAVTSVNIHNEHFGDSFAITMDGRAISSACVGYGLERWGLWLYDHVGEDPAQWPAVLRDLAGL